jgi:FkbM family methyltransferase
MSLFNLISFDTENYKVYFRYLGTVPISGNVRLSWKGLTIYHSSMNFSYDESIVYYISLNDEKIWQFVDIMDLVIETEYGIETFEMNGLGDKKEFHFLNGFSTEKYDTPYYTFEEIFVKKVYENNIVRVNQGDVVVDIGANYGFFVESILSKGPSQIYCYEPAPNVFQRLVTNYSKNNNISFFNTAVSSKNGRINFINDISSASNRISESEDGYEVDTININILIESISKNINFLKIDCEGCEKDIFETITSENIKKIEKIVVEYHSEEIKTKILDKLNNEGFSIVNIENGIIFSNRKELINESPKKKVALISTFCDTEKKSQILKENLKTLKKIGLDTMVIVPNFLPVDEEIIRLSDFVFYTKENPLLKYPIRQYTHWYEQQLSDGRVITLHRGFADYGWAALYQTKKLSQLAMTFDYDIFYHLIYDVEMDDILLNELLSDEVNLIHPRRNPNHPEEIWETTLHFMAFDRNMMEKVEKEITLDEYLSTNGVAEGEVLKWTKKYDLKISEHCVKDKVFYWENFEFFNVSPYPEFKMFLSKNPELQIWVGYENPQPVQLTNNIRIVFYDIPENFQINIKIDGLDYSLNPINWEFVELPVDSQSIREIKFEYNGNIIDFSEKYSDTMMNQIFYNFRIK